jgi:hypothetical protein
MERKQREHWRGESRKNGLYAQLSWVLESQSVIFQLEQVAWSRLGWLTQPVLEFRCRDQHKTIIHSRAGHRKVLQRTNLLHDT